MTAVKRLYRGDHCRVPYISLAPLISLRTSNCSPKFKRANESKVPANYCYFTMLELLLGQKTFQRTFKIPSFESIECVCHKYKDDSKGLPASFRILFSQVWNVLEQSACWEAPSIYLAGLLSVRECRLWLRGGLQNYSPASHCYAEKWGKAKSDRVITQDTRCDYFPWES